MLKQDHTRSGAYCTTSAAFISKPPLVSLPVFSSSLCYPIACTLILVCDFVHYTCVLFSGEKRPEFSMHALGKVRYTKKELDTGVLTLGRYWEVGAQETFKG